MTARSMDWLTDPGTNLWLFPQGLERDGAAGTYGVRWRSKYGSVVASAYEVASTDGMNERGLVANVLWLAESDYPHWDGSSPALSVAAWAQYVLDNFATVDEAVTALEAEPFIIATAPVPDQDRLTTLHLSLSDASGDCAIFEYLDGRLVVHHDRRYQVMTNSPPFDQQLAVGRYWDDIGGTVMLPGTNRAADRFVRAQFYIDAIPHVEDRITSTASVFSVIRNASVPLGISTPGQPNISSTRWRTVADHKDRRYYFDSVLSPSVVWVDLDRVDFSAGGSVRCLDLRSMRDDGASGDVTADFADSEAFPFAAVELN